MVALQDWDIDVKKGNGWDIMHPKPPFFLPPTKLLKNDKCRSPKYTCSEHDKKNSTIPKHPKTTPPTTLPTAPLATPTQKNSENIVNINKKNSRPINKPS